MRPHPLLIVILILIPLLAMPGAKAQQGPFYIVLYAHGFGKSAILTAVPQSTRPMSAHLSDDGLDFQLNPVLGENLQISGAITYNLYLRASGPLAGSVSAELDEVRSDGSRSQVSGSLVAAPVYLNAATTLVTLGVGPAISYKFRAGSTILLHIAITQTSSNVEALLVWDDPSAETSVRLPAISPTTPTIDYLGKTSFGEIFQAETNGTSRIGVNATFADAIGAYRFDSAMLRFTSANGTFSDLPLNLQNSTDYSVSSSVTSSFAEGQWQVSLLLNDSSGNQYAFTKPLVVAPFYPVAIEVYDSEGSTLSNATLVVGVDAQWFWRSITNRTGWGTLNLPSTNLVGPLNMTVAWSGTQSLFPLEVTRAATVSVQLTVYAADIKVTLLNLPLPLARVTLYQTGRVGENVTGIDGLATFGRLPAGDYTVTVEYLLATYQTSLHLTQSGIINVAVPFPHRTINTALLVSLIALGSVVLVRRKRGKFYPATFGYFDELTHGGLPEACFTIIAGNSGSGKSVLLNTLAAEHLAVGNSIYVINTEFPEKVREHIMKLGVAKEEAVRDSSRLICIDAYSAVGGGASSEEFSVDSHTDLTQFGLIISKCLENAGNNADVYLDSLNPIITVLRVSYIINFLQTVAARVKAKNGRLCVTVGTGIEASDLTKLEESADCVIETQLQESGSGQRKRLRIKKLRGKSYNDRWTRFRVEEGKGIIFLPRKKPSANHNANHNGSHNGNHNAQ